MFLCMTHLFISSWIDVFAFAPWLILAIPSPLSKSPIFVYKTIFSLQHGTIGYLREMEIILVP